MDKRGCIKIVEDERGKHVVDASGNELPGVLSVRIDMSAEDSVLTVVFQRFEVEIAAPRGVHVESPSDGNG